MAATFYNHYDVTTFGAKGDGAVDDTSAIQAAITAAQTAGGGIVFFPRGTFKVTGAPALTVTGDNIAIMGIGAGGSVIAHGSTAGDTLFFQKSTDGTTRNENIGVDYLEFLPSVTKTSGSEINIFYAYNTRLESLRFQDCFRAIQFGSTNNPSGNAYNYRPVFGFVRGIYAQRVKNFLLLQNCTDLWFDQLSSWNPDGTFASGATGITIDSNVESCNFSNFDIVGPTDTVANGNAALLLQSTLGFGTNGYNQFSNGYFDSFGTGLSAANAYMYAFSNVWFSDRVGRGAVLASTTAGFTFNGCQWYNCGTDGISLDGADHLVQGSQIHGMGKSSTGDGIVLAATSTGVRILGNRISSGGSYPISGTTRYGINIASGADNFIIAHNDTRGCGTGGINNGAGTGASRIVSNNL